MRIFLFLNIGLIILFFFLLFHIKQKIFSCKNIDNEIQQKNKELNNLQNQLQIFQADIKNSHKDLQFLYNEQAKLNQALKDKEDNIQKYYQILEEQSSLSFDNYENTLDQFYRKKEEEFNTKMKAMQQEQSQVENKLTQIKDVYRAVAAQKKKDDQQRQKDSFYEIQLTQHQKADIAKLQELKKDLYDPSVVSKMIWSSYVMKATTELCNRVLGKTSICGIYKITNKKSGEIYIGQSIDIASRWKQHVKCGLGIDASATNKLYNDMQKTGIYFYAFEVLQKCSQNKLNEKEKFWIDLYESNKIGLNTQGGRK